MTGRWSRRTHFSCGRHVRAGGSSGRRPSLCPWETIAKLRTGLPNAMLRVLDPLDDATRSNAKPAMCRTYEPESDLESCKMDIRPAVGGKKSASRFPGNAGPRPVDLPHLRRQAEFRELQPVDAKGGSFHAIGLPTVDTDRDPNRTQNSSKAMPMQGIFIVSAQDRRSDKSIVTATVRQFHPPNQPYQPY